MNDRILKIILACFLVVIIIFLSTFLVFALTNKNINWGSFNSKVELIKTESYEKEEIKKININTKASDIKFVLTDANNVTVNVFGNKDKDIKIAVDNGILNIEDVNSYFCFGFCNESSRVEISVPNDYKGNLEITTVSGDINLPSLNSKNVNVLSTSGDIYIENLDSVKATSTSGDIKILSSSDLEIKTVSGDIKLGSVSNSIKAQTTSGEVEINKLEITSNSYIKTVSGDVEISRINDVYVNTKTTSGDVEIANNNRLSNVVLDISTTSGDIEID